MPEPPPGYSTQNSPNPLGIPFIELQAVDSTNNYARRLIQEGLAHHGTAVFAHHQTRGKGQRGKEWLSAIDTSIMLSVVVNPFPLGIHEQFQLSACTAVAVLRFFQRYAGKDSKIKWPNDLYWQDRKAGGILIENLVVAGSEAGGKRAWKWSILGIGINIHQEIFPSSIPNAISLKQITGNQYDLIALTEELCAELETCFLQLISGHYADIYDEYILHLYKKSQPVTLRKDNRVFKTSIRGVTKDGRLETGDGIVESFDFGEVEWVI